MNFSHEDSSYGASKQARDFTRASTDWSSLLCTDSTEMHFDPISFSDISLTV